MHSKIEIKKIAISASYELKPRDINAISKSPWGQDLSQVSANKVRH